jgi:hypothetical protein
MEIKSFESSVQQFYQSGDDVYDKSVNSWMDLGNIKKPVSRPQTVIEASPEHDIQSTKLTESIRNDLDANASEDPIASFFHDLSGWDMDKQKTDSLNDTSSLSYLKYSDKKEDGSESGTCVSLKKKKFGKALAIRALLTSAKKPSTPSNIGYRSKNDWGSEEDSAARPYALDIPCSNQQVCEEEEEEVMIDQVGEHQDITGTKSPATDCPDARDLDQELNQLLEATKGKQKIAVKKPKSASIRRAVSGASRPILHQQTHFSQAGGKRSEQMSITGQKYHNSDFLFLQDKYVDRPSSSAIRCNSSSLPKISNQAKKTFPEIHQSFKKDLIVQNNVIFEKKDSGIEIPKWYNDSGTKPTYDQNLIRFMEIMGSKSSLRSPRKLSSSGFYSIPMPNLPPETRGFVFEKKPRALSSVLDEIMQEEQALKVDVLKAPIMHPNQRSFAEDVQSNREAKLNRKIKL